MKIAYLILAHTDPAFMERVVRKLTDGTEDHIFIHIDKKTNLAPFADRLRDVDRAHFLAEREAVYWAGYSSINATIRLFRTAVEHGPFDRYMILQGLDYPIRSNREIHEFFQDHPDTEFIRAANETKTGAPGDLGKYCNYWFLDETGIMDWLPKRAKNKLRNLTWKNQKNGNVKQYKKPWIKVNGRQYDIFRGWAHFALTHSAVEYILSFHDQHPGFNRYFMTAYASDESYFHTILYNCLHFFQNTPEAAWCPDRQVSTMLNLTYFEYPITVTVFKDAEDYPKLRDSGMLFFRKANSGSTELLNYIDAVHAREKNDESKQ